MRIPPAFAGSNVLALSRNTIRVNDGHNMRLIFGAVFLCIPLLADVGASVAGYTTGVFTSTGTNVWVYDTSHPADGTVTFDGVTSFSGTTPLEALFGTITLHNARVTGNGTFQDYLNLTVTFTSPTGQVLFQDDLQLVAHAGQSKSSGEGLYLSFGGFPSNQTFIVGALAYTVQYEGFFQGYTLATKGSQVDELFIANPRPGTLSPDSSAYLWGYITANPVAVPESGSVALILTMLSGVALGAVPLKRK